MFHSDSCETAESFVVMSVRNAVFFFKQNSDSKGDSKGKKTPNKPLKILEEDDEDLSALKDPSEKVSGTLRSEKHCPVKYYQGEAYSQILKGTCQVSAMEKKQISSLSPFLK